MLSVSPPCRSRIDIPGRALEAMEAGCDHRNVHGSARRAIGSGRRCPKLPGIEITDPGDTDRYDVLSCGRTPRPDQGGYRLIEALRRRDAPARHSTVW